MCLNFFIVLKKYCFIFILLSSLISSPHSNHYYFSFIYFNYKNVQEFMLTSISHEKFLQGKHKSSISSLFSDNQLMPLISSFQELNTPLIISNSIRTLDGSAVEFDANSSKQMRTKQMRINMSIFLSTNIATTDFYSVKLLEFDRSIDNK